MTCGDVCVGSWDVQRCREQLDEQRTGLKELKGLEDKVILSADKGNATMMMRSCDYDGEMLGTGTYGKLRGDPTATQENRLNHKLKGLENALYIS